MFFSFCIYLYVYIRYIISNGRKIKKDTKLTTVKILNELYNSFKKETIENEFTLQKLVNRSMFLYTTDNSYKDNIHNVTVVSGSHL